MGWAFGMVIAWKLVTYVPTYNIGCQYHILNFSGLLYQLGAKHNTVRFAVWPVGADIKLHCGHKVWCPQKHSYWYTASKCLALYCLQLADRQGDKFADTVTHSNYWELQMIWMVWQQTTAVTVLRIICSEYMYVEITVVSLQMYWNKTTIIICDFYLCQPVFLKFLLPQFQGLRWMRHKGSEYCVNILHMCCCMTKVHQLSDEHVRDMRGFIREAIRWIVQQNIYIIIFEILYLLVRVVSPRMGRRQYPQLKYSSLLWPQQPVYCHK